MTTATLNPPQRTKAGAQLRTINGLSFNPTCDLDDAEQAEADDINVVVDDIARREEELQAEREAAFRKWFDTTPRQWQEASAPFRAKADAIREDKRAILERRRVLLPNCQRAYVRHKLECEAELEATLDRLEEIFRGQGINEYSMVNGELAGSHPTAIREHFRTRLKQEPEAMMAIATLNKSISDLNVLVSQFPIVPNTGNCAIKWRGVAGCQVPSYVSELFV